ncbi:hypothetical protein QF036_003381 [Arthrobacter globiformis]|nr:hypothetical protein [Arthrobacter globiformis]
MRGGPGRADPEGLGPAARGDSREYWPQPRVPSVGPVHSHRRGRHGRTPDHGADIAVDHRAHTVPGQPARGHRSRAGPPDPGTPSRAGATRRTRRRTGRRGPAVDQLVPPRTGQKRSGIRLAGRSRTLEASSGQRTRHRLNRGGDRTGHSTEPCTRSRSRASDATQKPGPTKPGEPLKARPIVTSAGASNARLTGTFTVLWKPRQPLVRFPQRVDKHRSVQRTPPPVLPQRDGLHHRHPRRPRLRRRRTQRSPPQNTRLENPRASTPANTGRISSIGRVATTAEIRRTFLPINCPWLLPLLGQPLAPSDRPQLLRALGTR